jgi:hypothetical protein
VRRFSYRWKPSPGYPSAYLVHGAEGLDVTASRSRKAVLITARDLPPVLEEPWMPPPHQVRLTALLYYAPGGANPKHHWKRRAKELDRSTRSGSAELADRIVSEMRFAEGVALPDKLNAAYEWIEENVENPLIRRSGDRVSLGPSSVGFLDQLDRLYAQVARRLGARVDVVLAPDRRIGFWEPGLASDWSFDLLLLAIRDPAGSDDEMIFADPGSGLGFGQVPYFASGSVAFLAAPESPRAISIPHSVATQNISRTTGELSFPDGGSSRSESWSRTSSGQSGLVEAQLVSSFPAELRRRELERLCGAGADVEVEQARHALTHPPLESRLDCESRTHFGVAMVGIEALAVPWAGPWFQGTPYLPAGPRTHPVQLPYPWVEIAELRVRAPRGFRATEPPPAVRFSHEFGKYELSIETDDDGYRVLRALALLAPTIPAERYEDLRQFLEKADRADATTVEFVRSPP